MQRDVDAAGYAAQLIFIGDTYIYEYALPGIKIGYLMPMDDLYQAVDDVFGHHTGEIDGVLGAGEWRGIGLFKILHIPDVATAGDNAGDHVYALGHAIIANGLGAEEFATLGIEDDLEREGRGAGVVIGMIGGMDDGGFVGDTQFLERLFVCSGGGDGEVENLGNRSGNAAFILAHVALCQVVCQEASLLVCRACQVGIYFLAGDGVFKHDGIAEGIDIGIAGLQVFIDLDAAIDSKFQPGIGS